MKLGTCFLCGRYGTLEEHHVFGGPNRSKSERDGLKVGLCGDSCHRNGRRAAHRCRETSDALKQFWQIKFMMKHQIGVRAFILEYGRNYLELDYYDDEENFPMNITAQSGRLVRDPELRYMNDNKPVCSFCVAVDRPGVKDKADFIDFVAYDKKAEFVAKYFRKGSRIEVSGILTTRTYEKNGIKRKVTEVRADQVFFGDSKKQDDDGGNYGGNSNNGGYNAPGYGAPQSSASNYGGYQYPNPAANNTPASDFQTIDEEDAQLPF